MRTHHWPLYRVLLAANISYALVALIHHAAWSFDPLNILLFFIGYFLGWAEYYIMFEYMWHRFIMHRSFECTRPRWLADFIEHSRVEHTKHHKAFHGNTFRSTAPEHLAVAISPLYVFPSLFFAFHDAPLEGIFSHFSLPLMLLLGFLAGIKDGYSCFETIHWCTHIPGMSLDRIVTGWQGVLVLGRVAKRWKELQDHHHLHHELPPFNFGFSSEKWDIKKKTYRKPPQDFKEYEN